MNCVFLNGGANAPLLNYFYRFSIYVLHLKSKFFYLLKYPIYGFDIV